MSVILNAERFLYGATSSNREASGSGAPGTVQDGYYGTLGCHLDPNA